MCLSPSSSTLFPYTTLFRSLADNIALGGKDVTRSDVETAIETLGLTDWVASFAEGLDTPVGQRGEQLSAGERQLIALARAAVADPDLLVMDEATDRKSTRMNSSHVAISFAVICLLKSMIC